MLGTLLNEWPMKIHVAFWCAVINVSAWLKIIVMAVLLLRLFRLFKKQCRNFMAAPRIDKQMHLLKGLFLKNSARMNVPFHRTSRGNCTELTERRRRYTLQS